MKRIVKPALSSKESKKNLKNFKNEEKFINETRENLLRYSASFDTMEAYRSARTNIMFSLVDVEGCKKLIFTSSMAAEGKTTTCINMAISFAQTGANVLVIDTDLRRPRIHTYYDLNNDEGISNVLVGLAQLDDIIQTKDGIDFITAGYIPQNPAELLSSKKMEEVVAELEKRYDYIIFDTPPVGIVTDATTIAKLASGVIFIVRQNYTLHSGINSAFSGLKFANAKILGFILNDAEQVNIKYKKKKYSYYNDYYSNYTQQN